MSYFKEKTSHITPYEALSFAFVVLLLGFYLGYRSSPSLKPRALNQIDTLYTADSIYFIRFFIDSVKEADYHESD